MNIHRYVPCGLAVLALAFSATPVASAAQPEPVLIHTFANKCLDVSGESPNDGTPIIQYGCTGGVNQKFRQEPAA